MKQVKGIIFYEIIINNEIYIWFKRGRVVTHNIIITYHNECALQKLSNSIHHFFYIKMHMKRKQIIILSCFCHLKTWYTLKY